MASTTNAIPLSYQTPEFPSLYWPFHIRPGVPKYLYTLTDIWKFTLFWTLITIPAAHIVVALWAVMMQILSAYHRHQLLRFLPPADDNNNGSDGDGGDGGNDDDDEKGNRKKKRKRKNLGGEKNKNTKLMGDKPFRETIKWVWVIILIYVVIGAIEALVAGSVVGLILGAVYNAGYFKMSTWTPLFWGIINMGVLVLSSFSISGGL